MRKFGLIGYPLGHSFSKKYFTDKFEKLGITDCNYDLYPIEFPDQLENILAAERALEGINVTIPHKETIIALLDELSEEAQAIGAVNCIKITNGIKKGYNTDAFGFHQSIKPFLEPQHDRALILGTGGASKAVAFILQKIGIDYLFVSREAKDPSAVSYSQLNEMAIRQHKFIINTTPLGTYPNLDQSPDIPYEFLTPDHFVVDLVYNPEQTLFMQKAAANGAMTLNGYSMLQQQAEKSWEIWNQA
ncbi:MAG: shikimate dehydrogenase [Bacteroidota bacterium]